MRSPVRFAPAAAALALCLLAAAQPARAQQQYRVEQSSGAAIVPGTTQVPGLSCDDCVAPVTLPFAFTYYGQTFGTVNVSSNGNLQFSSASTDYGFNGNCMPAAQFSNVIHAHWNDLNTNGPGEGVFTSVSGAAPDRVFNIEWRASYSFRTPGSINFQVRLFEGQQKFEIVYGQVAGSGVSAPGVAVAPPMVGAQFSTGATYTSVSQNCNVLPGGLRPGLKLTFNGAAEAARFIAGRVIDPDGRGLAGVTVSLSGNASASAVTDAGGRYSFDNLAGTTYTVAPSESGSNFFPASRSYVPSTLTPFTGPQIVNFVRTVAPQPGDVLISEFRMRGRSKFDDATDRPTDEYVELYNNTDSAIVVNTTDNSAGWLLVAAADADPNKGRPSYVLRRGIVIPPRHHFLASGSLYNANYPYAPGESSFPNSSDIADDSGIALFSTSNSANFSLATRIDAAGFNRPGSPVDALYREGAGLPPVGAVVGEHAFVRRLDSGKPRDTDDNASDFLLVSTDGSVYNGVQTIQGAPGPENLASPVTRNAQLKVSYVDPGCTLTTLDPATACARVRSTAAVPNGAQGTIALRRRFTNRSATAVTRLRFRVVDLTTHGSRGAAEADLRLLSSADSTVNGTAGAVTLRGLTLEQVSLVPQNLGGGINSSLRADAVSLSQPLQPGQSLDVEFLLGVQQTGTYRFFINIEAMTGAADATGGPTTRKGLGATGTTNTPGKSSVTLPRF